MARRDTLQKWTVNADQVIEAVQTTLKEMQQNLFDQALEFQTQNTREANSYEEFKSLIETHGGFVSAHWDGTTDTEDRIKEETKATIRCIPLNQKTEDGQCIYSGNPSKGRVLFAKAY